MSTVHKAAPWHLWLVGIVAVVWNSIGVMSYMMARLGTLDAIGMTPDQIAYFDTFPAWANGVWALGVWGAFAASVLLLLRRRWAVAAALISVVGLTGTSYFSYVVTTVPVDIANPALDAVIWATTLFTLWYVLKMRREGVLA